MGSSTLACCWLSDQNGFDVEATAPSGMANDLNTRRNGRDAACNAPLDTQLDF